MASSAASNQNGRFTIETLRPRHQAEIVGEYDTLESAHEAASNIVPPDGEFLVLTDGNRGRRECLLILF